MQDQVVDNILVGSLVSTNNLESLVKGYILNCKTEGKSPTTVSGYHDLMLLIWNYRPKLTEYQ